MKKIILSLLILAVAVGVSGFTQSEKSVIEAVQGVSKKNVYDAPSGTIYGVVESTSEKYVVNTPVGKYDVEKSDGGFSCLGIYAKIQSHKGNIYNITSSLGDFEVDIQKCTIIKK